jgi:hypothetical protein
MIRTSCPTQCLTEYFRCEVEMNTSDDLINSGSSCPGPPPAGPGPLPARSSSIPESSGTLHPRVVLRPAPSHWDSSACASLPIAHGVLCSEWEHLE